MPRKSKCGKSRSKKRHYRRRIRIPRPELLKWQPATISHIGLYAGLCGLTMIPAMAQGDDVGYRAGREIFLRGIDINMKMNYQLPESATFDATIRWFLFQSNDNTLTTATFNATSIMESLEHDYLKYWGRIIHRGTVMLQPSAKQGLYKTRRVRVNKKIKWNSATFTDLKNPLYLLVLTDASNDANNKIDFQYKYTVKYNDL